MRNPSASDGVFCARAAPGKLFCFAPSVGARARTWRQATILKRGPKQVISFFYAYYKGEQLHQGKQGEWSTRMGHHISWEMGSHPITKEKFSQDLSQPQ